MGVVPQEPFGRLVRRYRRGAALTQEALAERAGLSVRAVRAIEAGSKHRPREDTVRLLLAALAVPAEEQAAFLTAANQVAEGAAVAGRHHVPSRAFRLLDLPVGGFLGSVPDRPLVARGEEIVRIRSAVKLAAEGQGQLLLLVGEPGAGKTRLAQEATLICRASGMYLATGRCYESQQAVAFYPFLEVLSRLAPAARLRLGIDPLQRWPQLAPLIPDVTLSYQPAAGEGDQQRLFWAVAGFLEVLARVMPIVVALDDLHWADQASLELFHHLAGHLRQAPVLLLGTYRDVDVGRAHPLRRVLRDLHRENLAELVRVGGLNQEETRALMASTLGGQEVSAGFAEVVHRHTEGNAFFVQEVVHALVERGEATVRDDVWEYQAEGEIAIPRTVHDVIGERLARLPEAARAILEEASVLGLSFGFDELQGMGDRSEEEIETALGEATRASVVRIGEGDTYAFNHALTQRVLYRELAPRRRKRLHLAAGSAIEQLPSRIREQRVAELAWHYLEGGERDRALRYAVLAGDQAEGRFAHREAARRYRLALGLAQEERDPTVEGLMREKLGRALEWMGRYDEALQVLEPAADFQREVGDVQREIRLTIQLGSIQAAAGRSREGIERVQALLERVESLIPPPSVVELYILLERLYFSGGRYPEALASAERAAELARSAGDAAVLARADLSRGSAMIVARRIQEGLQVLEGAASCLASQDDPFSLSRAYDNLANGYFRLGQFKRGREFAEKNLEVQERVQNTQRMGASLYYLGTADRMLGNWDRARAYHERDLEMLRAAGRSWRAPYPRLGLARLYVLEGAWELARSLTEEALELARRNEDLQAIRQGQSIMAELDLYEGHPGRAAERLEPLIAGGPDLGDRGPPELLPILAAAYHASGDLARALQSAEEAVQRTTAANLLIDRAESLLVRGKVRAAQEQWEEATQDLEEVVHLARAMPYPHLEARGLFEWGVTRGKKGELEQARERLEEALAIFQRLGAQPLVGRTEKALGALGAA